VCNQPRATETHVPLWDHTVLPDLYSGHVKAGTRFSDPGGTQG